MKIIKINILLILLFLPTLLFSQISDKLTIELSDIKFQNKGDGSENMEWKSYNTTSETGSPKLPVYDVSYVLPVDAKVTGIQFTYNERQLLKQGVDIAPVEPQIPTNDEQSDNLTQQKSSVYDLDNPYPNVLYEIKEDGFLQGYHIITLRIYPFQYTPKSQILYYYPKLEYTINYVIGANPEVVKPLMQSEYRAKLCKSYIESFVKNPQDVVRFGSSVQNATKSNMILQRSTTLKSLSSLSGLGKTTPDYIIITNNALKPAFQRLADWKTKKGIFTIIKTVEEIGQSYYGCDLTEKIRNYLIDSKTKWGEGLFVLLGGDLSVVPARFVNGISGDKLFYPTDKYYSTSNYWSYTNNVFTGSNTNLAINVAGRIPVGNSEELNSYIDKLIAYEHAGQISNLSYYKNILVSDAFMLRCPTFNYRDDNGKSKLKSYRDNYLSPSNLNTWLMFDDSNCSGSLYNYSEGVFGCKDGESNVHIPEGPCVTGDEEFSKNNFISALNNGGNSGLDRFHIIYHMDHCNPTLMGTSSKDKGQYIRCQREQFFQHIRHRRVGSVP